MAKFNYKFKTIKKVKEQIEKKHQKELAICDLEIKKIEDYLTELKDSIINEKPIIGTNIGGIKEIIDEYNCGYTFNFGDISKLSELILNIDKNENIFKIRDVKTAILKKHSWGKISEDLIKLYEGLYE